jgi:predicted AAA+ superfamily ATPase
MVARNRHVTQLAVLAQQSPVVAILGARQVGKTTLARELMSFEAGPSTRFDLEDADDLARLAEPKLALAPLSGLVVLDEVQRRPDLFPVLRVLVDRHGTSSRVLVLGSASPELLRQSSETLAGRIAYHELTGFRLDEVGLDAAARLWLRGGFPRAFLAASDTVSADWLRSFVKSFLERDIPQLGIGIPSTTLHRFWTMLAHYHAQIWNGAELARAFGVSASTIRSYLDILTGALVVRQLQPWHENIAKRQVKAPKVYIADSGILHSLLGIDSVEALERHPKVGASWEGFALGELATHIGARADECFFWATHAGAELDLLVVRGTRRLGFEVKRTTTPSTTKSMRSAIANLGLEHLYLVHAGEHTFALDETITAVALCRLISDVPPL